MQMVRLHAVNNLGRKGTCRDVVIIVNEQQSNKVEYCYESDKREMAFAGFLDRVVEDEESFLII